MPHGLPPPDRVHKGTSLPRLSSAGYHRRNHPPTVEGQHRRQPGGGTTFRKSATGLAAPPRRLQRQPEGRLTVGGGKGPVAGERCESLIRHPYLGPAAFTSAPTPASYFSKFLR